MQFCMFSLDESVSTHAEPYLGPLLLSFIINLVNLVVYIASFKSLGVPVCTLVVVPYLCCLYLISLLHVLNDNPLWIEN